MSIRDGNRDALERSVLAGLQAEFKEKDYSKKIREKGVSASIPEHTGPTNFAPPPEGIKTGGRDQLKNALFSCMGTPEERAKHRFEQEDPVVPLKEKKSPPKNQDPTRTFKPTSPVYEDGTLAEAGDIVSKGETLAEVTMVAGNGVVMNIPVKGDMLIGSKPLKRYKKVGKKRGG